MSPLTARWVPKGSESAANRSNVYGLGAGQRRRQTARSEEFVVGVRIVNIRLAITERSAVALPPGAISPEALATRAMVICAA
jgi:hypothetical protein